ncbi:MAG: metal-sensitive transcriptional regulator [Pseudomonadota bacterium]|nr:metal-sensitive transcriptional regulator [Pseudomonadota bacterium]
MLEHPNHNSQINRLKRAEGQIRGIVRLIDEGKYCIDILNQLKAVQKALASVEANILETHIENCVAQTISSPDDARQKIAELTKIIKR